MRGKYVVVCALVATGCFRKPSEPARVGVDAPGGDGPLLGNDATDAPPDAGPFCLGTGILNVCFAVPPSGPKTVGGTVSTSATNPSGCTVTTAMRGGIVCVAQGADVTVDSLRATGQLPLVVVATNTITVGGTVDLASHVADPTFSVGAGGNPMGLCAFNNSAGANAGGAGGSFASAGGKGGDYGGTSTEAGGTPQAAVTPTTVRGGCNGGIGTSGTPGFGGGAIYVIAGASITIGTGSVLNASGGGGRAVGSGNLGGTGGGAGGMVGLDAPTITNNGTVIAEGGGGGAGGDTAAGGAGSDPDPSKPTQAAPGNPGGGSSGLYGGNGSQGAGVGAPGGNGSGLNGAGGGGGGAGIVLTYGNVMGSGSIEPPATH